MSDRLPLPLRLEISFVRPDGERTTVVHALPLSVPIDGLEPSRLMNILKGIAIDATYHLIETASWEPDGWGRA